MVDQNLLTIFVAVTAVAVLIEVGILAGIAFASMKLSRQADRALDMTGQFVGPLQSTAESLQIVSMRLTEASSTLQQQFRKVGTWLKRDAA